MTIPWAGYRRVSRVGDRGERLLSPDQQAEQITLWARGRGVEIDMLPAELDESGGKLNRPILQQAITGVEQGRYAGIVVAYLSRLSRRLPHTLQLFERVEAAGGQIVAVAENIDTTTRAGRLQRNTLATFAEFEHDGYKEHIERAKVSAVERGVWPVLRVPFGYRKREESDRRLEPDDRAPLVVQAFKARAAGAPWAAVADILGVTASGAARIVSNRAYLGELTITGLATNLEAHEAIVERALFDRAQIAHPRPARTEEVDRALLAGIVRCAGCQRLMTPDWDKSGPRYRCNPRNALGRCQAPAIVSAAIVDPYVETAALIALARSSASAGAMSGVVEEAEAEAARADGELAAFVEHTRVEDVGAVIYKRGMDHRRAARDRALAKLTAVRLAAGPGYGEEVDVLDVWPDLTRGERNHVLRRLLGAVWVRRGRGLRVEQRVRVVAVGHEPHDLPRPGGRAFEIVPFDWPDGDLPGEIRAAGAKDVE